MAIQPDLVGTVTLTSGSPNFTVAGINLQTGAVQAGDTILLPLKGLVLTIATVTGASTGTLTDDCPAAAAGSGQVCRVRYQADLSRVSAATRVLMEMLANGNLSSIAGLTSAANKLPYYTGSGTAALTGLSAFARTLLDDENDTAARATLGADNAANLTTGTVPDGRLPARMSTNTAAATISDCNDITEAGRYWAPVGTLNAPASADHMYVEAFVQNGSVAQKQVGYSAIDNRMWQRVSWYGGWSAWEVVVA